MDFALTEEQALMRSTVREFAEREISQVIITAKSTRSSRLSSYAR